MQKLLLLIFISLSGMMSYAQTDKYDKIELDNIKRFYTRLKNYKMDTKTELVWEYTYEDSTQIQLQKLGEAFEKGGLKVVEIAPTQKSDKIYYLKVSEIKKYSRPEDLHQRVKSLNEVAQVYKIMSPYAALGAEKQSKQSDIKSYKAQ